MHFHLGGEKVKPTLSFRLISCLIICKEKFGCKEEFECKEGLNARRVSRCCVCNESFPKKLYSNHRRRGKFSMGIRSRQKFSNIAQALLIITDRKYEL